jgi:hypothetical protein
MDNFRIKTTVEFDLDILVDGVAPSLSETDVFTFILKEHIDDTDAEAIIEAIGTNTDTGATWELTPTDTDIDARKYYYEFKWNADGQIYIVESSTVEALKRVFD